MPEEGISESDSENTTKRKRGRPVKWVKAGTVKTTREPYDYEQEQRDWPSTQTRRGQQDRMYQGHAMIALIGELEPDGGDRFHWLLGTIKKTTFKNGTEGLVWPIPTSFFMARLPGATKHLKSGVLAELGRIIEAFSDGKEWAIKFADQLCAMERKLTVKEAVRRLREWRLDRQPKPANEDQLADVIIEAIDAYSDRHVSTKEETAKLIDDALWGVMSYYEWLFEDEPEDVDKDGISESASEKQEDTPC